MDMPCHRKNGYTAAGPVNLRENSQFIGPVLVAVFVQLKKPPAMRVVGNSLDKRKSSCVIVYVGLQTTNK